MPPLCFHDDSSASNTSYLSSFLFPAGELYCFERLFESHLFSDVFSAVFFSFLHDSIGLYSIQKPTTSYCIIVLCSVIHTWETSYNTYNLYWQLVLWQQYFEHMFLLSLAVVDWIMADNWPGPNHSKYKQRGMSQDSNAGSTDPKICVFCSVFHCRFFVCNKNIYNKGRIDH